MTYITSFETVMIQLPNNNKTMLLEILISISYRYKESNMTRNRILNVRCNFIVKCKNVTVQCEKKDNLLVRNY